jgi:PKHD-type hydroxylase
MDEMILEIQNFLSADELSRLRELAQNTRFVDGRATNSGYQQKQNLQIDPSDAAFSESSRLVNEAYNRSQEFRNFALPKRIASPILARYEPGMRYGPHADAAYLPLPNGMLRSDLSSTVFLADPKSYEGGELVMHLGDTQVVVKYPAGSAVVYPSTTMHEVRPVTSGQRLVALTFVESFVPNEQDRSMLFELGEVSALEGDKMHVINRMRLELVRQNLLRRYSVG